MNLGGNTSFRPKSMTWTKALFYLKPEEFSSFVYMELFKFYKLLIKFILGE